MPKRSRLKRELPFVSCIKLHQAMATIMVRFKNAERGRYLARRDDKVVVLPKDAPFNKDEVAWKLGFKMIQTENCSFDLPKSK